MKKDDKIADKGSIFGQYALTGAKSGQMRGATVFAAEDCHFAILDRKSYDVRSLL
jgi:CRP-like cAMP-binding protein